MCYYRFVVNKPIVKKKKKLVCFVLKPTQNNNILSEETSNQWTGVVWINCYSAFCLSYYFIYNLHFIPSPFYLLHVHPFHTLLLLFHLIIVPFLLMWGALGELLCGALNVWSGQIVVVPQVPLATLPSSHHCRLLGLILPENYATTAAATYYTSSPHPLQHTCHETCT